MGNDVSCLSCQSLMTWDPSLLPMWMERGKSPQLVPLACAHAEKKNPQNNNFKITFKILLMEKGKNLLLMKLK